MQLVDQCAKSGLQVTLICGLGDERNRAERELLEAGVPLALVHRAVWSANLYRWPSWFLLARDLSGRAQGGAAIEQIRTRAMPGYAILRMRKFGSGLPIEVCRGLLEAAAAVAMERPRVLKLQVNVLSRDLRQEIATVLEELKFREVPKPSTYRHTLVIDLRPSEDEIFAAFGKTARKRIRESIKLPLRTMTITDPGYAERLNELQREAFQRTGGHRASEDWESVLRMSKETPNLSAVFGLFLGQDTAPENMEAFGWVCNNGDHGEYRAAGSTRKNKQMPLGYLLLWDMIRWAKATGAEWFDMGGVTLAEGPKDGLEGISYFKRFFSHEVVEVGSEWLLEPDPVRAGIADVISNGAGRVREWMGAWR